METERAKLPTFKGKPLIEIPAVIPQIGFMQGDFGKEFLEEYKGIVSADYQNLSALNVLNYGSGVVKGSNPFAVVLANQILRQEGLKTATQADLEKLLRIGGDLRGTYEDTGLVLRSKDDKDYSKNTPLAKVLAEQVRARGIKFSPKNPIMVPLTELELEKADNGYGLTFRLREDAEIYEVPILSNGGQFNSEDVDEKTGLPTKLGKGNRTLYTRNSGLSRLGLLNDLGLYSDGWILDDSDDGGRVVVVSGKATSLKNLQDELMEKINAQYRTQLDDLNLRRTEAEKAVREIMNRKK